MAFDLSCPLKESLHQKASKCTTITVSALEEGI